MTIQQFGDAFKAEIKRRKGEVYVGKIANFFDVAHNYVGGESALIDA